jgi:kynurenine formamidase
LSGLTELLDAVGRCRAIDLAQPYFTGMPHYPIHAPYLYSLSKKHGEQVSPGGASSAAEAIAMSTHVGTHIDALCHFSCNGKLHGGVDPAGVQSYANGLERFSVDTIQPLFRRGVLLDIARLQGTDVLPVDFVIMPEHLDRASEGIAIYSGDVVLLRTGWSRYWNDPGRFISQVHSPGPGLEGARWLSDRKIFAAGSETAPFEFMPNPSMSVHVHLLVESGSTASPIRPIALVP